MRLPTNQNSFRFRYEPTILFAISGQRKIPIYREFTAYREFSNLSDYVFRIGGPEGDRTLDLCVANAALSQLSYKPKTL